MIRSIAMFALLVLAVARSDGALNEPERRVRLGACGTDHCIWCKDFADAFCPAVGATVVHDATCDVDLSCDIDNVAACTLNTGTSFTGELVMLVDDAPCGPATGACNRGNGAVTKLAFCGTRADTSTFKLPITRVDCCRRPTAPTGNVSCGAVADSCVPSDRPRGNPFLCDQDHKNCDGTNTSCCLSEDIVPEPEWLGLQIFAPPMASQLGSTVPGSGVPVITSASDVSLDDHSADGQPTVRRYAVQASFVTPLPGFDFPAPDCAVSQDAPTSGAGTCDFCGDGEVDPGEACDDGASNGAPASCCDTSCALKPGCVGITGSLLLVADDADQTKRKVTFKSKDPGIDTRIGSGIDPVANGASFQLYNPTSGESVCFSLPSANESWVAKGKPPTPSYVYKDSKFLTGPCKSVKVKHGKQLQVACLAKTLPIAFSLDEPSQGSLAVQFRSGTTTYCATFGGDVTADSGTNPPNAGGKGKFKAKNAPTGTCPLPPVPCP